MSALLPDGTSSSSAPLDEDAVDRALMAVLEAEGDGEGESARLAAIAAREAQARRPWHGGRSVPQASDGVRLLRLGGGGGGGGEEGDTTTVPDIRYRSSAWPPHAGEIVATGGIVWDSALVLGAYLSVAWGSGGGSGSSKRSPTPFPTRVVELGSGLALPSLAAHVLGAPCVVSTDVPARLSVIEQNHELNRGGGGGGGGGGALSARALAWSVEGAAAFLGEEVEAGTGSDGGDGRCGLVLASDVLFSDEMVAPLVDTVSALCAGPGSVVLSCCEHRWAGALAFYEKMAEAGFEGGEVAQEEQHELYRHPSIHLYRFVKV